LEAVRQRGPLEAYRRLIAENNALGGTGREEVTPCTDLDFAFLFDDALEGNAFLLELQRQMLHTSRFQEWHGFSCIALPFGVDDMPSLVGKQLNSFLDMRPVFDPSGWADRFRERMRFDFADAARSQLLSARRRVAVFAKAVIERELRRGRA
jgi:hypothetical protein